MNKIFHRYFAFVMIVSAFAMGMQYSPSVNGFLSASYVNVLDSMGDGILHERAITNDEAPARKNAEANPVEMEMEVSKVNSYAKPGDKDVTIMEVVLSDKELDATDVKVKIGVAREGSVGKVTLYDPVTKTILAEGEEVGKYWEFGSVKFSGEKLEVKVDLKKDIFPGERMRPVLKINGIAPVYGNYLTVVGK